MNFGELRKPCAERLLQIRAAAQSAGAHEIQSFLDVIPIRREPAQAETRRPCC